jgi:hypothetical protein
LLAYFARVDLARAEPLVEGLLARAREAHGQDGIHDLGTAASLLARHDASETAEGRAAIERALLEALDDDAPALAAGAAKSLRFWGSPAAQPRLWRRLARFHATWRGRAAELRAKVPGVGLRDDASLESDLAAAIARGSGWLADGAALERLASLLVSEFERRDARRMREGWKEGNTTLAVHRDYDGDVGAELAQYRVESLADLEKKLAQLPRGTRLTFQPYLLTPEDEARTEAIASKHGLRIER